MFIPNGAGADVAGWAERCESYCTRRGYQVDALAWTWQQAAALACEGLVDVVVVGSRGHLDSGRVPRLEVVDDEHEPVTPPGQRRPRVLWPPAAWLLARWRGR